MSSKAEDFTVVSSVQLRAAIEKASEAVRGYRERAGLLQEECDEPTVDSDKGASLEDLLKVRSKREHGWSMARNVADTFVQTYVEYGFLDDKTWLESLSHQVRSVLETNAELQDYTERVADWKKMQVELTKSKAKQRKLDGQCRDTHSKRVSSEVSLRDKEVSLRERLGALNRERARLLEQRRSEDQQMAKLKETSTKLQQQMLSLNLRKAELENDNPSEYDDYMSQAQEYSLDGPSQHSHASDEPLRYSKSSVGSQGGGAAVPRAPAAPRDGGSRPRRPQTGLL
mmetsp:Transcript_60155/g.152672  ORF Transcript_60155/g.152672 Transcript_60155/m.152672 type:complete len:285 (-) Transcript_60155:32-886(-)